MFLEIILDSELDLHCKILSQSLETSGSSSKLHLKFYYNIYIGYIGITFSSRYDYVC